MFFRHRTGVGLRNTPSYREKVGYKDKEQQRDYQRQWMARRRSAFFSERPCSTCGSGDDLELDHVDRAEKVSHRIWSWTDVRREAELAKCQVLCKSCHVKKSQTAGDLSHRQRVPREVVDEIIARYNAGGITQQQLADEYGVSQTMISSYVQGKKRKHL